MPGDQESDIDGGEEKTKGGGRSRGRRGERQVKKKRERESERERKQRRGRRQSTGLAKMFVWANRIEDSKEEKKGRWRGGRERSRRNSAPLYRLPGHQVGPNCLTQTLQGLYIRSNNCWRLML